MFRQPKVAAGMIGRASTDVDRAEPYWRRLLRAPSSFVRRFLVGGLHAKLDELTLKTDQMQAQITELRGLVGDRIHQLDIKIRGPHQYDEHTDAIRLNDGYVLVPRKAQKLRIMLADAPADGLEPGTCRVLRKLLAPGMTAVDIGANVGALTLACARAVGPSGKVYAFEPEPAFASLLDQTFDLNGISWIKVERKAISHCNGRANFHVSPIGGHSSLYELPPEERTRQMEIEVDTSRLDDILPRDAAVDLVKMDVEGAELDVLAGMPETIKNNPELAIIAEFGPSHLANQKITPEQWTDRFLSHGFNLFAIDETTGRCEPASAEKLKHMHSVNLVMTRFGTRAYRTLVEAV
jgi:FkbM family methyltransferase